MASNCIGMKVSTGQRLGIRQTFFSGDVAIHSAGLLAMVRISGRSRAIPKVAAWNSPVARLAFMPPTSMRKSAGHTAQGGTDEPWCQFGCVAAEQFRGAVGGDRAARVAGHGDSAAPNWIRFESARRPDGVEDDMSGDDRFGVGHPRP